MSLLIALWLSSFLFASETSIQSLCRELKQSYTLFKWTDVPVQCDQIPWVVAGQSVKQRPLLYLKFGDFSSNNVTLVLSTVHGDEVTPVYIGFKLIAWLKEHQHEFQKTAVIVAPLVNPDGFFAKPRTRVNANGVDVNRNLPTHDWSKKALEIWKHRYKSNARRFPGQKAGSEPETVFQQKLIAEYKPQKILSIHAPLNGLDYDGPTSAIKLSDFPNEYTHRCEQLKKTLNAKSSGFFTGSLGNYAGQERGIPTITLELPSANPKMALQYWVKFQSGIKEMIMFAIPPVAHKP
jgi:protein MpaA